LLQVTDPIRKVPSIRW